MRIGNSVRTIAAVVVLGAMMIPASGCISVGNGNGRSVVSTDGRESKAQLVQVDVYPDGHLNTGSLYVGADQIATLAKEIQGCTVELRPVTANGQNVTLEQAVRVRNQLLENGVKRVILPMGNR